MKGIIPNFTMSGWETPGKEDLKRIADLCGAVAVSWVPDRDRLYNLVHSLTDAGCQQVNIHFVLSKTSIEEAKALVKAVKGDVRLLKLNAVVFLQYKDKGRGLGRFESVRDPAPYDELVRLCERANISFGFDSCSAPLFLKSSLGKAKSAFAEPCESGLFSAYVNCDLELFPCSFCEGEPGWDTGIALKDLFGTDDFSTIWYHPRFVAWREALLESSSKCKCEFANTCRCCPVFDITGCREEAS